MRYKGTGNKYTLTLLLIPFIQMSTDKYFSQSLSIVENFYFKKLRPYFLSGINKEWYNLSI